jgi:hypothetical protein
MLCVTALAAAFPGRRVLPVPLPAHARGQEKKNRRYKYSGRSSLHLGGCKSYERVRSCACVMILIRCFASELLYNDQEVLLGEFKGEGKRNRA